MPPAPTEPQDDPLKAGMPGRILRVSQNFKVVVVDDELVEVEDEEVVDDETDDVLVDEVVKLVSVVV